MTTTSIPTPASTKLAFGTVLKTAAVTGGMAAVINAVIWIIANLIGGVVLPFPLVPIFTILFVVLGGILYFVLSRFLGARTNLVFIIVSILFLLGYAFGPIVATTQAPMPGMPLFNTTTVVATELMHLVAGGLAIRQLTGLTK